LGKQRGALAKNTFSQRERSRVRENAKNNSPSVVIETGKTHSPSFGLRPPFPSREKESNGARLGKRKMGKGDI